MKKIVSAFLLFFGGIVTTQAQLLPGVEFGLKGGVNLSSLKSGKKYFNSDNKIGYQAGIYGRVGVLGFHLQPEIYLSSRKTLAKTEGGGETDLKFTAIDIPVLLGKRFGLGAFGARIQTGPIFSFNLKDNQQRAIAGLDPQSYKKNGTSWAFGIGADVSSLRVDLRYEMGLSNINNNSKANPKINTWSLGVGYRLFKMN
ncbi:porin family protein [Sphingobacterium kitahiroshimense]|uniref:Porin family protein n=1 Tax=Sphingobacterium kitahiroshimense TaxID=470446 RepID=A0ABV0BP81_9SPHI